MTTVPDMPMLSASLNAGLLGAGPEIDLDALDVLSSSARRRAKNSTITNTSGAKPAKITVGTK